MRTRVAPALLTLLLALLAACDGGGPTAPEAEPATGPALAIGGTPGKTTDQIVVVLDVQPDDGQDLGFTFTGDKKTNIKLDDDADPTLSNIRVMPSLKAGSYTVALPAVPVGYSLVGITCQSFANGGSGIDDNAVSVPARFARIQLQPLERVVCTFVVAKDGPLTVTINQASWQQDPAVGVSEVYFEVEFSNTVTDFDGSDVTVGGVGYGATVSPLDQVGIRYQVTVGVWESGQVSASIAAGVVRDISGQWNAASTSTDNVVEVYAGEMVDCNDDTPGDGVFCT